MLEPLTADTPLQAWAVSKATNPHMVGDAGYPHFHQPRPGTARHGVEQNGTVRHGTARHGAARHGTSRQGTARFGTERNGTAMQGLPFGLWGLKGFKSWLPSPKPCVPPLTGDELRICNHGSQTLSNDRVGQ